MALRHNYKNMLIWRKGIELAGSIYAYSRSLPDDEKYGLRSQMTRAGVSVPTNVAEGSARKNRSFKQFLRISLGSCYELETQMIICQQQQFGDQAMLTELMADLRNEQKMLQKFHDSLSSDNDYNDLKSNVILGVCLILLGASVANAGMSVL